MSSYILPSILTLGLAWALLFLIWVAYYVTHNRDSLFDVYDFWENILTILLSITATVIILAFLSAVWWLLKLIWTPYL